MSKSEMPETIKAGRRPKQAFDPALDAPVALTPEQLEAVAAGLMAVRGGGAGQSGGHTTMGIVPPIRMF